MAPAPIGVVIVDDDVPTRVGLHAIFSSEKDLRVLGEAASGPEACAVVEALRPDVVLMDVRLPGFDGIEATRIITSGGTSDAPRPRVIILTTFEVSDYLYRSLRAGASGFLLKRAPAEELVEAVRMVADGDALPMPRLTRAVVAEHSRAVDPLPSLMRSLALLTEREAEVLTLVARGLSNQEIAQELVLSLETVKTHVKHVYAKLDVRDRAQAVVAAYEGGLVPRSD